jgi:DNA-binding NtrC family response regulator
MESLNVVLYHNDAGIAQALAANLSQLFPSVTLIHNCEDIRPAITRQHADVLVLDMETSRTGEVERLHQEFPSLSIVCTHRLADEELWTQVLNQGAEDMCIPWKADDAVRSVLRERARRAVA